MPALSFRNASEIALLSLLSFSLLLKSFQNAKVNLQRDARITFMFWKGFNSDLKDIKMQFYVFFVLFCFRVRIVVAKDRCMNFPMLCFVFIETRLTTEAAVRVVLESRESYFWKRASKNCQSMNWGDSRECGFVCLMDLQVNSADRTLTMKVLRAWANSFD